MASKFIKSLCCGSASSTTPPEPQREKPRPAQQQLSEMNGHNEPAAYPSTPLQFYTNYFNVTPRKEALEQCLTAERELRSAFATGKHIPADPFANLVPIFVEANISFPIRENHRLIGNNEEKYLMRLPERFVKSEGSPATVGSFQEYTEAFKAFTHSTLQGLDWSNVVVAGSAAMLPLLPHRKDLPIAYDDTVENRLETYFQYTARSSDIDIFIHGLDEDAAIQKIAQVEAVVRKNQRLSDRVGLSLRTEHAITFVAPKWPYRHVQVILRLYRSVSEILTGFDVDCACVAFDGNQVYANPRALNAISTQTNHIDLSRRSPSYEHRLYKYRARHFDAHYQYLQRERVKQRRCDRETNPNLEGLARLISYENILGEFGEPVGYKRNRFLKTIDESGEARSSDYAALEVPYGEHFTAHKVRKFISMHSKEPYVFGTVDEVLREGTTPTSNRAGKLEGPVKFIVHDPGQQLIGSFHPLTEQDWTSMAYGQK